MGDRPLPAPAPAPISVRVAFGLLVSTPLWGIVLSCYATWALNSIPAGTQTLTESLTRHDRYLLESSWVLNPGQPITPIGNLSALIWLGLAYLVFLPLAYYLARGFRPARLITYLLGAAMVGLTAAAVVADEDFADPDPVRLSAGARQAWLDLFPPGYGAVHTLALVALLASVFMACLLIDRPSARRYFSRARRNRR